MWLDTSFWLPLTQYWNILIFFLQWKKKAQSALLFLELTRQLIMLSTWFWFPSQKTKKKKKCSMIHYQTNISLHQVVEDTLEQRYLTNRQKEKKNSINPPEGNPPLLWKFHLSYELMLYEKIVLITIFLLFIINLHSYWRNNHKTQ